MTVDLNYDELVLLIQLVQQRCVELQNNQIQQGIAPGKASTPFEVQLFKKLYDARTDEMKLMKQRGEKVLSEEGQEPPQFGGEPGEPVPVVDPKDVRAVWELGREYQGQKTAIGVDLMRQACSQIANVEAVYYRSSLLWMMGQLAAEDLARFMQDGVPSDGVFHAAANVPCEWMGVGIVRKGPPFDVAEFLRLCDVVRE
jgi:hypothetical protein